MSTLPSRIGVSADDLTGANDIGGMFVKHGLRTAVFTGWEDLARHAADFDVVIVDTNSRYDPPDRAADKVRRAIAALRDLGCDRFYKKACSVFRGNPGAEFDAMLDTLGEPFSIAIAAFPKNGRTTRDGVHFVHGVPLDQTPFADDPVNPMRDPVLAHILAAQSPHPIALLSHETVARGAGAVRAAIERERGRCRYLVCDVLDQGQLAVLALACENHRVWCGSSALAEELAARWPRPARPERAPRRLGGPAGVLVVAGSVTPATRAQTAAAREAGLHTVAIDIAAALAGDRPALDDHEHELAVRALRADRDVLLHTPHRPEAVAATKARGVELGLSDAEAGRRIGCALADVTESLFLETGVSRLVVAGGETAAEVARRLGIAGNEVLDEIEPGLPAGFSIGGPAMFVVLKSGSFGSDEFLLKAVERLRKLP